MPVASKADLIVSCMNDIVKIMSEPFHSTIDLLTDSDVHALAQTTSLLIHHAEEAPIAPAPAPLLRVPAPAPEPRVPSAPELRVLLATYQTRVKPVNHREPRLPSTSLRRSPRNHPLTLQANSAEDSALDNCVRANAAEDSALGPYHTNVDEYAMRRSIPPSTKKVKFAIDIERPGSPTAADQHPSMLLDDTTLTLPFGDYKANGIQFVAFKVINPDTGLPAEYKELSKSSVGPQWQGEHCNKIGRLAQGFQEVKGTSSMHFIPVNKIPPGKKATYCRPVCAD